MRALGGLTAQADRFLAGGTLAEPEYDYLLVLSQYWRTICTPLAQLRWLDLHTDLEEGS